MSNFDTDSIDSLTKRVKEDRTRLQASDAGTGKSHSNASEILAEKMTIARTLTHMAFSLSQRDAMSSEEFAVIVSECLPYSTRATVLAMESTHTS